MPATSIYEEIKGYGNALSDNSAVKRRAALKKLGELLGASRQQLVDSIQGNIIRKKKGMTAVWKLILGDAIKCVKDFFGGDKASKTKAKADDVATLTTLVRQFLLTIDQMDPNLAPELDSSVAKNLFDLCCSNLECDKEKAELSEIEFLRLLTLLCSRKEFVAQCGKDDIDNILSELDARLDVQCRCDQPIVNASAKAWETFLTTLCQSLGVGMQLWMSDCIDLVSSRCLHHSKDARGMPWELLKGAALLMMSHPEQAIEPLRRDGGSMLKLARGRYVSTDASTRDPIIEYLYAHLRVCQVAGRLQGLIPGDLGDLDAASLDLKRATALLELIASDEEIDKIRSSSLTKLSKPRTPGSAMKPNEMIVSKKTRQRAAQCTPILPRQRRHLELCARLLSTSQRMYLSETEWKRMTTPISNGGAETNPLDEYLNDLDFDDAPEAQWVDVMESVETIGSPTDYVASPFGKRVLCSLWMGSSRGHSSSESDYGSKLSSSQNTEASAGGIGSINESPVEFSAVFAELSAVCQNFCPKSVIPVLQLISACAEAFPLGECWASRTIGYCYEGGKGIIEEDEFKVKRCSLDDLALVVFLVSNLLESSGGPGGDVEIQSWILRCLLRLAESTEMLATIVAGEGTPTPGNALSLAWHRVWNLLFQPKLRYRFYTRAASCGSIGDLVLVLITEIVNRGCTNPMQLDQASSGPQASASTINQLDIWLLPIFKDSLPIETQSVFDLISSVLHRIGLMHACPATLDNVEPEILTSGQSSSLRAVTRRVQVGLRYKILCFCLGSTERVLQSDLDCPRLQSTLSKLSACIIALISGSSLCCPTVFQSCSWRQEDTFLDAVGEGGKRFSFTTIRCTDPHAQTTTATKSAVSQLHSQLWNPSIDMTKVGLIPTEDNVAQDGRQRALNMLFTKSNETCLLRSDFISSSESDELRTFATDYATLLLSAARAETTTFTGVLSHEAGDESVIEGEASCTTSTVHRITWTKILVSASVSPRLEGLFRAADITGILDRITDLMSEFESELRCVCQRPSDFFVTAESIVQLFRVWLMISAKSTNIENGQRAALLQIATSLFHRCDELLWNFNTARLMGHTEKRSFVDTKPRHVASDNLSDDESDSDINTRKRSRPPAKQKVGSSDESEGEIRGRTRRKNSLSNISRRRTPSSTCRPPDLSCAMQLASMSILLKPTFDCCMSVYRQIALINAEDEGGADEVTHVDLAGCSLLLRLLSSDLPVFAQSRQEKSIVSLFCRTLSDLRFRSDSHSDSFLCGFEELVGIVKSISIIPDENWSSSADSKLLIEPLVSFEAKEKTALKLRPHLTVTLQRAAAKIFQTNVDKVSVEFETDFSKVFVKKYIGRLSEPVRLQASLASGVAFRHFPDQNAVFRSLVDTLLEKEKRSNNDTDLFKILDRPKRLEGETLDDNAWKDALLSWQSSSILYWGVVGGTTTDLDIARTIVFDLVSLASARPYLELMCSKALRKMTQLRGFKNTATLIRNQLGFVIQRWIETGKHLLDLPLLLTAPWLLDRLLLTCGHIRNFWPFRTEREGAKCDFMDFRRDVVEKFVTANASLILSVTLACTEELPDLLTRCVPFSPSTCLVDSVCQALAESDEGTTVGDLVNPHLGEIMAVAVLLIQFDDRALTKKGENILRVVNECLDTCDDSTKHSHAVRAISKLVQLVGSEDQKTVRFLHKHSFSELVAKLGEITTKKVVEPSSFFRILKSSPILYLLQARYWLYEEESVDNNLNRWETVESIGDTIFETVDSAASSNKLFCVRVVLEVLRDSRFTELRVAAISWLQKWNAAILALLNTDFHIVADVVGALMQVHENAQDSIIDDCTKAMRETGSAIHRGKGVLLTDEKLLQLGHLSSTDVWGWDDAMDDRTDNERFVLVALKEHIRKTPEISLSTALHTYELIESIFETMTSMEHQHTFLFRNLGLNEHQQHRVLLREINPKYHAQSLLQEYLLCETHDPADSCQSSFRSLKQVEENAWNFESKLVKGQSLSSKQLGLNARFLVDTLCHLHKSLQACQMKKVAHALDPSELIQAVIGIMVDGRYPEVVHLAASRVLGELETSQLDRAPQIKTCVHWEWLEDKASSESSLRESMHTLCMTQLFRFVVSEGAGRSLVALEAVQEMLTTESGITCFDKLKGPHDRKLYGAFKLSKAEAKVSPALLAPADRHLCKLQAFENLKNKAKGVKGRNGEWCWEKQLWCCTIHDDYDNWVRNIVGAVIWCCYGGSKSGIKGKAACFRACLKMSLMEHSFAEALFPVLVLDLLISASSPKEKTAVTPGFCVGYPNSPANQKLSECFDFLLTNRRNTNSKATLLVTECLDMLRRVNLRIFLGTKVRPNGSMPTEHSDKSRMTSSNAIGVVLQTDPLSTLNAFVTTQQFSGAILFAESYMQTVPPEKQSEMLPLLKDCYVRLQEYDTVEALHLQTAKNLFLDRRYSLGNDLAALAGPMKRLQHIEILGKYHATSESTILAINCLDNLGLDRVMSACIEKIVRENQGELYLTQREQRALQETWSKMHLNACLWNSGQVVDMSGAQEQQETIGFAISGDQRNGGFYQTLSVALSALDREDCLSLHNSSVIARSMLIKEFSNSGREAILEDLALFIEKLKVFNELDILINLDDQAANLLNSWISEEVPTPGFQPESTPAVFPELTFTFRESVMNIFRRKSSVWEGIDVSKSIASHLRQCLSLGLHLNQPSFSEGSLKRLKHLVESIPSVMGTHSLIKMRYQEVLVMEGQGYFEAAIQGARQIMDELAHANKEFSSDLETLRAESTLTCGLWMKKHKVNSAKYIQETFLLPASEQCQQLFASERNRPNAHRACAAHIAVAETAAGLYENASLRVTSKEWKKKETFLESKKQELLRAKHELETLQSSLNCETKRRKSGSLSAEENVLLSTMHQLRRNIKSAEAEKSQEEGPIDGYLELALQQFGLALSVSVSSSNETLSGYVFQMISLWFDSWQAKPLATDVVAETIVEIPSFRFVPLTYQIFSRLDEVMDNSANFQKVLRRLVERMCTDHPYHCLPQLFALCNGSSGNRTVDHDTKVEAAKSVLGSLHKTKSKVLKGLVESYSMLTDTSIALALAPTKAFTEPKPQRLKDINLSEMTTKGKASLHTCLEHFNYKPCILTKPPVLQVDKDYGNGIVDPLGTELISGFDSKVSITETGAHRPKIVVCIGNAGGRFKQLVKGLDDIRKDAVMQQVFRYVNSMMKRTRAKGSRKSAITTRKLQLVTYNIIPLSPNTGVLEWVEETMPFGDFLVDKPGKVAAHSRYNPGELGYLACRRKIMDADATNRRQVYDEVCQNFSPAFRFFFIEEFITNLQDWHAAKVRYTRSCAVSSIVGHMLGIGDRHSQNILIHKKTGEVVHIDFGIVFEQGRELQVPETVPFRLTRDIVDGMGPTETSGTFSRAAEETTRVLRENSKALLTILSAIVADPLYKWKKAAEKARKRQQLELLLGEEGENCSPPSRKSKAQTFIEEEDDEEENAGTRAINKIHEKLQGLEEGTSSERQSVESQVQLLINAARDPDNLCALYHGWSAWL